MERYKIAFIMCLFALTLNGCVYESKFTCEGFKNAGRPCAPVSSNIESAIAKEETPEEPAVQTAENASDTVEMKGLFVKCDSEEPCSYKPADAELILSNQDAKKYIAFKKNEKRILADELTSYGVKINTDSTPVTTKPKVLRVTILPYEDNKGRLNMIRRVYMILQKSSWLMGDYLVVDDAKIEIKEQAK